MLYVFRLVLAKFADCKGTIKGRNGQTFSVINLRTAGNARFTAESDKSDPDELSNKSSKSSNQAFGFTKVSILRLIYL